MVRRIAALSLLAMLSLPVFAATPSQENPFEPEIRKFEEQDLKGMPAKEGVVFVGSSSIRMWNTLKEDFPKSNPINRGFGGSQISDSVYYADRIVMKYDPKLVVFFAGTNDLAAGKTPETVLADFKAFVEKCRAKKRRLPIVYISITPAPSRWNNIENVKKANQLVKDYTKQERNILFLDVFDKFLDDKGGPRPELFIDDQLHMNRKGYEIWVKALAPILPEAGADEEDDD